MAGHRIIRALRTRKQSVNQRHSNSEPLEPRLLLAATVATIDPIIFDTAVTGPLAPRPGHTFSVSGGDAQYNQLSQWANASAITPNTTNDLVMNVSPFDTNYLACCEAAGGSLNAALLTNGISQTQVSPAPSASQPAVGDAGASDASNNADVVSSSAGPTTFFSFNLGTAPFPPQPPPPQQQLLIPSTGTPGEGREGGLTPDGTHLKYHALTQWPMASPITHGSWKNR
ncbi:MAG TPA: LEPR-XLL domain-containing protein [Tepidisphaeraceae bacterium]|jgi:hypothetical protein